ncbi:MAG: glycosyltransferase family 4 protein [Patescibacteria group bacterium]|nr:glycosyltransferase family 4 protein [Patescibacteria group bacterium]
MSKPSKKILILNYEFPPLGGGASPVSYEIAKGYVQREHKVDVVTMSYKDLPSYENKDGINIYRVPCLRSKKEICHPWEQLIYIISAKRFLRKHLKNNSYDINHTHFIIPTGIIAKWLKKKFGIPYIITSHGSDVLGYNNKRSFKYIYPLVKKQWKEIVKEAKAVVCPSNFLKNKILNITTQGNLKVIPNGIDKNKFKPMKKEKRILIVTRLFENKGVQDVLDALKGLNLKGWKVDIVGEGPYRNFLEKKAKENNLKDIVKFHGWVENNSKEMKNLYGHASIFISASWFESFGLTVLEAIQAGCYPLVSDIGGHREILKNKKYFLNKDLKIKIEKLINQKINPPKFNQNYNWKNVIKKYEEILR